MSNMFLLAMKLSKDSLLTGCRVCIACVDVGRAQSCVCGELHGCLCQFAHLSQLSWCFTWFGSSEWGRTIWWGQGSLGSFCRSCIAFRELERSCQRSESLMTIPNMACVMSCYIMLCYIMSCHSMSPNHHALASSPQTTYIKAPIAKPSWGYTDSYNIFCDGWVVSCPWWAWYKVMPWCLPGQTAAVW